MKRYRLKKDLPTFKAGQECWIAADGSLMTEVIVGDRPKNPHSCWKENITVYSQRTIEKFPNILTEWFEEIPDGPKTVLDLEDGDTYYRVAASGPTGYYQKVWQDNELDNLMRDMGEVFLTEEDAKKEVAGRKAKQILLWDAEGFKPDWRNIDQRKWIVYYNHSLHCLVRHYHANDDYGSIYFATKEDAEASIKAHEKEWKIYLGVEE